MERSSGILMHLTSLPSDYGIGSIGNEAIKFMDKLVQAKQTYWQILPLTQPDAMYSPYASSSTYAGNIMLIDIEKMVEYGYLLSEDVAQAWNVEMQLNEKCNEINEKCDNTINYVNYAKAERIKMPLFHKAYENFFQYGNVLEYDKFYKKNKRWLSDYALYSSIKSEYNLGWYDWNEKLKNRDKEAIKEYKNEHKQNIEFYAFLQFVFYRQWSDLKKEIKKRKLKLMGDIPMYVSYDSADVWSQPKQFLLNKDLTQDKVAGVPPDYFSIDGQLWGNPIFNWEQMRKDGYKWWIDRIKHCSKLYDCIRIDHFRAFDAYWQVNADKKNARIGKWVKGEGIDFINILKASVPKLSIVAEDLGVSTKSLVKLLKESGFPGMKVIEFAFDDK
ncbi:MAG: 4-alpha-glucanotransferase, partial [Clostridia bacterium]